MAGADAGTSPGFNPVLLLAGPVLRRVTLTSVSVWVATSQACAVTLDVYSGAAALNRASGKQTGTVATPRVGTGHRTTVEVGGALHIAVVTAPVAGVLPDSICSYNVTLDVTGAAAYPPGWTDTWDLGGLKLLDAGDAHNDFSGGLGYAEGILPSFAAPPATVEDLRLFHGSCFKLHGEGPSMMPGIDDILSDALPADATASKQRPHLLMLTGDQIYADDLATPLLPLLTSIGAKLLVAPETIPVKDVGDVPVTQAAFPAGRRERLVLATAGMTSDDSNNHMLGLGEWAAYYLLNWTGRMDDSAFTEYDGLWPRKLALLPSEAAQPGADPDALIALNRQDPPGPVEALLTPLYEPQAWPVLDDLQKDFTAQRDKVSKAGDDGDKVRRALANIPVLTICDDHEVTDDWFITGAWRARVLASSLGRAIVRNALVAYLMFQAWGNTPDAFATDGTPEAQLLALVPQLFAPGGSGAGGTGGSLATLPDPAVCAKIDHLLGLDDKTGTGTAPRVAFNYHLDVAGVRLVVLDTRTHREYGSPDGPPGLLTAAALDAQLPIALTDDVPLLIVVSPAPVLGPRVMEEILSPTGSRAYDFWHSAIRDKDEVRDRVLGIDTRKPFGDFMLDVEQWSTSPVAFERFLNRVTRCPRVVLLAGDVHYAASFVMDYQRFTVPPDDGGVPPADPLPRSMSSRVVHFTASAIRNAWFPAVTTLVSAIGIAENLERIGFEGQRLGWTRINPPVFTDSQDVAAGEARPLRARLRREPVVLPTAGWKDRHTVRAPEWLYQVSPLADTRTDDVRFAGLVPFGFHQALGPGVPDAPPPPADHDVTGSLVDAGGPYSVVTALHAGNVEGAAVTRTLVFQNNIGVVTFTPATDDSPLGVQMALYFVRQHPAGEDEKAQAYVVHAATLDAVALEPPGHVGGG